MKTTLKHILIAISSTLCITCSKEQALPVHVNFGIDVFNNDYSIPVEIVILNKTKGAESYQWTFEGGIPNTSTERNPRVIRYTTKGNYTIKLFATNADGSEGTKEIPVQIDDPVHIDFKTEAVTDNYSPVSIAITNTTTGANQYQWTFEGGKPEKSTKKDPETVIFETPGDHLITLEVTNGLETKTTQKQIHVEPYLIADFDYKIDFQDDDLQAPVHIQLQNKSISSTSYQWNFSNANPKQATTENPEVTFTTSGTQTITLIATNGKETKTSTKTIEILPNTNLRVLKNIQLGINTAHTNNTIGSFFATTTRKVYTASQITPENQKNIDIVFFGLNSKFIRNLFVAPDQLETTTFPPLIMGQHTKFINTLENCNCTASLSITQYDTMLDDTLLQTIDIKETPEGLQHFDNETTPRIVLFQTEDGRKGAIKIKKYVDNGPNSYIEVDIKVQKEKK